MDQAVKEVPYEHHTKPRGSGFGEECYRNGVGCDEEDKDAQEGDHCRLVYYQGGFGLGGHCIGLFGNVLELENCYRRLRIQLRTQKGSLFGTGGSRRCAFFTRITW